MSDMHPIDALIARIYDASFDPGGWNGVLQSMRGLLGGAAAVLYQRAADSSGKPVEVSSVIGYPPESIDDYGRYYRQRDIRIPIALRAGPGQTYVDERDLPFHEIQLSEIQNDFYRPAGVGHITGLILSNSAGRLDILSVHREIRRGGFDRSDIRLMQQLAPHVIRAREIERRFADVALLARGTMAALDHFHMAVFVVGADCSVRHMNTAAEAMARAGIPLYARAGRLCALHHSENTALQSAVVHAAAMSPRGRTPPTVLALTDEYGVKRLRLLVVPGHTRQLGGALALIFGDDCAAPLPADVPLLTRQFGLTSGEARVVSALTAGSSVPDIAEQHKVSPNTVRTQLKNAMAKSGVRTQTQMVARALRSLAGLRHV